MLRNRKLKIVAVISVFLVNSASQFPCFLGMYYTCGKTMWDELLLSSRTSTWLSVDYSKTHLQKSLSGGVNPHAKKLRKRPKSLLTTQKLKTKQLASCWIKSKATNNCHFSRCDSRLKVCVDIL